VKNAGGSRKTETTPLLLGGKELPGMPNGPRNEKSTPTKKERSEAKTNSQEGTKKREKIEKK